MNAFKRQLSEVEFSSTLRHEGNVFYDEVEIGSVGGIYVGGQLLRISLVRQRLASRPNRVRLVLMDWTYRTAQVGPLFPTARAATRAGRRMLCKFFDDEEKNHG